MEIGDLLRKWIETQISADDTSESAIRSAVDEFFETIHPPLMEKAKEAASSNTIGDVRFIKRNIQRWKNGFLALDTLITVSTEAGQSFQREFLQLEDYKNDVQLGMLMRIHARSIRVSSEIIVLMKAGYADGALSRWRSLYELALAALSIARIGRPAAIDYFLSGKVKALEGMKEHRNCADRMNHLTLSEDEIRDASERVEKLLAQHNRKLDDYNGDYGWLRKYIKSGKRQKVEEFLGLSHWNHDYKWASQDVHSGYREMRALLAMSEAGEDILLVGPSNSGMADPGHRTAICLAWTTTAFTNCYLKEEDYPFDSFRRLIWTKIINRLCDEIGEAFSADDSVAS